VNSQRLYDILTNIWWQRKYITVRTNLLSLNLVLS